MADKDGTGTSIASGLDALFHVEANAEYVQKEILKELPVDTIKPCPFQPRRRFSESELNELASSIKLHGILQPLIVRPINNCYELISGERRWRAAQIVSLQKIPCVIKEVGDDLALAFSLVENIQRSNLNIVEEARAYHKFYHQFKLTHEQVANQVGKSRSHITNLMRLLDLNESILTLIESNQLTMGHAKTLLTLDSQQQTLLTEKIIKNDLTVRETEKLSQQIKLSTSQSVEQVVFQKNFYIEKCESWSKNLSQKLSSKVTVKLNAKGEGRIVIHVDSPDEVDWLVDRLKIEKH